VEECFNTAVGDPVMSKRFTPVLAAALLVTSSVAIQTPAYAVVQSDVADDDDGGADTETVLGVIVALLAATLLIWGGGGDGPPASP
jgi:cytochrome bd-type quinol oxidase subunit 1